MYARLDELSWRLEWLGLTHRSHVVPMLHRMAGTNDIAALRILADVVEPVKDYTRIENLKTVWDFRAPLNRLVDAANPESDTGRHFQELVQRYIESQYRDSDAETHIRELLTAWRDNDVRLQGLVQQSFLLREVGPISSDLSALGTSGLQALDYLDKAEASPEAWRVQQLSLLDIARLPKADLLLTVVAPVKQLVEATTILASRQ
jgi:hexosaminidase